MFRSPQVHMPQVVLVLSPSADSVFKSMLAHMDAVIRQVLVHHGQSSKGTPAEQGTLQFPRSLLVGLQVWHTACNPTLLWRLCVRWASRDVEAGWNWLCLQCKGEYTAVMKHCPSLRFSNQGQGAAWTMAIRLIHTISISALQSSSVLDQGGIFSTVSHGNLYIQSCFLRPRNQNCQNKKLS